MDLEKFQAELTAELVKNFHREMFEKYGVTDKDIVRILERTRPHGSDEKPVPGQQVLIRYVTKEGAENWAISKWTGMYWGGKRTPVEWYFLPTTED